MECTSYSIASKSLRPRKSARLLCPWDSPGRNIGVVNYFPPGDLPRLAESIDPMFFGWQGLTLVEPLRKPRIYVKPRHNHHHYVTCARILIECSSKLQSYRKYKLLLLSKVYETLKKKNLKHVDRDPPVSTQAVLANSL